jgi:PAS domain S-box-containing protein
VLFINEAGVRKLGASSADELVGCSLTDFVVPAERATVIRRLHLQEQEGQKLAPFQYHGLTRDGREFEIEVHASLVEYQGAPAVLAVARDLTERRQLEEQLRRSQKLEALGRLAGGVAHDFNNLLSVIIHCGELLLQGSETGEQPALARNILEAARRGALLVRQLMAFSKTQSLQPELVDLNQVVHGMDQVLGRLIGPGITLDFQLEADLGLVRADRSQMEQVLLNLVLNARDAIDGEGRISVRTARAEPGDDSGLPPGPYITLSVSDTGRGMPPEVLAHIFEPFFTTKEPGRGWGLGLAVAYGIATQSGGDLRASSEVGRGSTLTLYLPRAAEAPARPAPPVQVANPGGSETILVAEDEALVRALVRRLLSNLGYSVLEAEGGEAALRLCRQHDGPIHLLLTDVVMPGMNGFQLARAARELRPEMRQLFMSGYALDACEEEDLEVDLLAKPFSSSELARRVRAALDRSPMASGQTADPRG